MKLVSEDYARGCLIRGQMGLFGLHEDVIARRKSVYQPKLA